MDALKFNLLLKKMKYDKAAVEEIYSEYYTKLKEHVRFKFGKLISDPVDLTQDIFLKLMTLKEQKFVTHPLSWLYALADNYIVDLLRKKHIEEVEFYDNFAEELLSERTVMKEDVRRAMSQLDEDTQKILYLHFWEGRKFKDIAKELNMTDVNVRVKASRAYQALEEFL